MMDETVHLYAEGQMKKMVSCEERLPEALHGAFVVFDEDWFQLEFRSSFQGYQYPDDYR